MRALELAVMGTLALVCVAPSGGELLLMGQ